MSTRTCPHCKATILASALICPGCRGHLRFDTSGNAAKPKEDWRVEGSFAPEKAGDTLEYCILVSVRNERNEEVARHVVNVGALQGDEKRTFALTIETTDGSKK